MKLLKSCYGANIEAPEELGRTCARDMLQLAINLNFEQFQNYKKINCEISLHVRLGCVHS